MEPRKLTPQRLAGNAKRAFTLIELLIVITIIAIMIGAATYSWNNARVKGRDGKRKTDLKAVQQALELYFQNNGKYPFASSGQIQCNVTGDSNSRDWGTKFFCDPSDGAEVTYMQQLPKDPAYQSTKGYYYVGSSSPYLYYILGAELENTSDPDKIPLPAPWSVICNGIPRNYCVMNP
jgi:prepilin-type N-terminal cleavage/methylation domain-containing protein